MITGKVHSIESFGTLDGPGVRTVVFLQGCPNRCKYCHNVDCAIDKGGKEYTVNQLVEQVMKNKEYWDRYSDGLAVKGGVTFSGGEPLHQIEFLIETAKELKKLGVHVVVDTSAFATFDEISALEPYVDLFMISIKHMDDTVHKDLVGNSNVKILENIKKLDELRSKQGKSESIRIRFVIIPGITDNEEHIKELGKYISEIKCLEKVELLPYSTIGKEKWIEIFGKYSLEGVREGNSEDVERFKDILSSYTFNYL